METKIHWTYALHLSKDEFLIVSKALRGTLKDGLEKEAALALQEKMVRQKHEILEQALDESAKVITNIENKKY
jgi:hypothetical protein